MVDLHFHSVFSDGTNTPEELAALGAAKNLTAMSLTDHDNAEGCARFAAAASALGIATTTGVELSAEISGSKIHILGYGFDPSDPALAEKLEWIQGARVRRNAQILANLSRLGFPVQYSEMMEFVGEDGKAPGRPHIARALVAKGFVKNVRKAFDKLLGRGKPACAERERIAAAEAIALIRGAGGVAVLAHPCEYRQNDGMSRDRLRELVAELVSLGLAGIEAYHSANDREGPGEYLRLAKDFDLVPTGGSDCHGANTPALHIGDGYGSLSVPDESFTALLARRGV